MHDGTVERYECSAASLRCQRHRDGTGLDEHGVAHQGCDQRFVFRCVRQPLEQGPQHPRTLERLRRLANDPSGRSRHDRRAPLLVAGEIAQKLDRPVDVVDDDAFE